MNIERRQRRDSHCFPEGERRCCVFRKSGTAKRPPRRREMIRKRSVEKRNRKKGGGGGGISPLLRFGWIWRFWAGWLRFFEQVYALLPSQICAPARRFWSEFFYIYRILVLNFPCIHGKFGWRNGCFGGGFGLPGLPGSAMSHPPRRTGLFDKLEIGSVHAVLDTWLTRFHCAKDEGNSLQGGDGSKLLEAGEIRRRCCRWGLTGESAARMGSVLMGGCSSKSSSPAPKASPTAPKHVSIIPVENPPEQLCFDDPLWMKRGLRVLVL